MIFSNIFAIALGSNSADDLAVSRKVIERAIEALGALADTEIIARANHYQSKAYPAGSGADYINTVILLRGDIAPSALLEELHKIEESFGRDRESQKNKRWQSRILDLDILFYGDKILPNPQVFSHWQNLPLKEQMRQAPSELILPHPRLQNRAFVLAPLNDIAPDWQHPVLGKTTKELLNSLPKSALEQTWVL